jgi:LmbE family N-acetylglucosaminyl deacetylase
MPSAAEAVAAWQALPAVDFAAIGGGRPILVLAPHPDDEALGCGGLIAAACARGAEVRVVVLTDGSGSHPASKLFPPPVLATLREAEARAAAGALGLAEDRVEFWRIPDGAAPQGGPAFAALVDRLGETIARFGPGTVCATWGHDPHPDHVAAHRLAATAARTGMRHLAYPIWGWALAPDAVLPDPALRGVRLDISRHMAAKQRAIAAYASQTAAIIADDPTPRLSEALLANFRRPYEVFLEPG